MVVISPMANKLIFFIMSIFTHTSKKKAAIKKAGDTTIKKAGKYSCLYKRFDIQLF
jgi:hypothetical protein